MTRDEKESLLTHCATIQLAVQLLIIELNETWVMSVKSE
jgi:hypothetical protein